MSVVGAVANVLSILEENGLANTLRVRLVGADNAGSGWGSVAHIPSLRRVDGIEPSAVCTSRRESAAAAGEAYGVRSFASYALKRRHKALRTCPTPGPSLPCGAAPLRSRTIRLWVPQGHDTVSVARFW
jgi:hypothetical protein